jgi:hypothetical protein
LKSCRFIALNSSNPEEVTTVSTVDVLPEREGAILTLLKLADGESISIFMEKYDKEEGNKSHFDDNIR